MGSQVSSDGKKKDFSRNQNQASPPNNMAKIDTSGIFSKDNFDSYRGVKSQYDGSHDAIIKDTKSPSELSTNTQNDRNEVQDPKILTEFVWKEGGNMVYLTGSFDNWSQKFLMTKLNNTDFVLNLELTRGIFQYKFIVDGNWLCSRNHPVTDDGEGNFNNIIDNSIFEVKEMKPPDNQNQRRFELIKSDSYSNIIPSKSELNKDAPFVPGHYFKPFNIDNNTNQHKIGNQEFIKFPDSYHCNENNSFKKISVPPHINLNHLSTNLQFSKKKGILATSTVQRVRNKFLTFVYYKPIN